MEGMNGWVHNGTNAVAHLVGKLGRVVIGRMSGNKYVHISQCMILQA